jgi:hypothetical protein
LELSELAHVCNPSYSGGILGESRSEASPDQKKLARSVLEDQNLGLAPDEN